MTLNDKQKALLRQLLNDPIWVSILDELDTECQITPWKPGIEGKAEDAKTAKFHYDSGKLRRNDEILYVIDMRKADA